MHDSAEAILGLRSKTEKNCLFEMDWKEVRRLAERPEYRILPELTRLVNNVSRELGKPSPYDP